MAECSDDKFVPENEDFILFAEDFVDYVMILNYPLYFFKITGKQYKYSFDVFIRTTVRFLDKHFKRNTYNIFRQIHLNEFPSPITYTRFADSLVLQCFSASFDARNFLLFCVRISKMAALYYEIGIENAPMLAKSYIINILKTRMTVDGWNNLHMLARENANMSRENYWILEKDRLQEREFLTSQKGSKRKLEVSADEENDAHCPSRSSCGNNCLKKSESNDNLVSETPNFNRIFFFSKRHQDFTSNMENNVSDDNLHSTD